MNWEENVRRVVPYVPGEQPKDTNVIKLNTNENPYPPAPGVEKLKQEFSCDRLRLYPDPEATVLVDAIAKRYGVKPAQVFVGVGSDDVLAMAFLTFFNGEKPILFPDITYSFYDVWADLYRIPYKTCPLDENFRMNIRDYEQENGGIIFPNPNAPTGVLETVENIETIVKNNPDVVVIVDEAYIDFGGTSVLPLVEKYENLLVVQTFSKSRQLAGARLGLAMGNAALIADLNRVKFSLNPYNINRLTLKAGQAALEDTAYFEKTRAAIMDTRAWTMQQLTDRGFTVLDSRANFVFASTERINGRVLYKELKKNGILVRHFDAPRIENWLRITIGTPEQMQALMDAVDKILEV